MQQEISILDPQKCYSCAWEGFLIRFVVPGEKLRDGLKIFIAFKS